MILYVSLSFLTKIGYILGESFMAGVGVHCLVMKKKKKFLIASVEMCTPTQMENMYFPNALFQIYHASLA
jgi:hypothetical protein